MMTNMSTQEEEEPASPSARLMQAPGFDLCIYAVMGFSTVIDLDLFKYQLEQTLVKHPRFSSLLIEKDKKRGKYSWKRTKVDIEKHVFALDLDPNIEYSDEFVENFMSDLSRQTLDPTKPLWEIHVLNVKTSDDANSTAIFKIDHSIGDGVSLIALVLASAAKMNNSDPLTISKKLQKSNNNNGNGDSNGLVMIMKRLFLSVWTIFLVVYYTLIDVMIFFATLLFLRDTNTIIKGERGVENSPKRYVHRIVSFDDVKLVKTAMQVSVNDVLLGITEAGLSRYLNMRYEKHKENNGAEIIKKSSNNTLPRNLRLRAGIAFNLRPAPSIKDLIEVMDEKKELKGTWGNMVGFVLIPLTIALQKDPLAYVRSAKSIMDRKKLSLLPNFVYVLLKLIVNLFGTKVTALLTRAIFYNTTVGFSNVVGPQEDIILYGHPLSYISPTVSGFPLGLVIHYQSCGNKLIIALAADEKLIPNPHQLCDDLQNSLQNFKEAVIKREVV